MGKISKSAVPAFVLTVLWLFALPAQAKYNGGTGDPCDPYQINDPCQLNAVGADPCDWDKHFVLTADIDMAGYSYMTAVIAPDTPDTSIYFDGIPFEGVFDGDGHIVSNLTINTAGACNDYLGLFGKIEGFGAEIKNLGIENINITGGDYSDSLGGLCGENNGGTIINCYTAGPVTGGENLGGLCGSNYKSTITNCYATGPVTGRFNSYYLGGLCGYNNDVSISDCYASGSVTGGGDSDYLGGLCGCNHGGIIINCYAAGSVAGDNYLGGLCGSNNRGTITNCYATGSVTGDNCLGGLCGVNDESTITNCYAAGLVTGDNALGGLCGYNDEGTITNCFWDTQTSGMSYSDGGTGKTTAQMQTQSTFTNAGWDFTDESANGTHQIWQMPTGGGYPVLSSFNGYIPVILSGDGSVANPYLISDAVELGAIYHYNTNACFRLQSDVDLTGIQWSIVIIPVFGGCFDGNGYVIYNMNIEGGDYLGLFGTISGSSAEIKNLGIENINITGGENLGGLCGGNYKGTITNCYATGSVNGDEYLGGLCGWNYYGTITNCYSGGSVTGDGYLGGLFGRNHYGTITNCYSGGSVSGDDSLGGLCGDNYKGTITNCYATGSVTGGNGSWWLGGLCGYNLSTITNCYATGAVTGGADSYFLGGLCGYNYYGIITNCYATGSATGGDSSDYLGSLVGHDDYGSYTSSFWNIDVNSGLTGVGNVDPDPDGVIGEATANMQIQSTFTDYGWDFLGENINGTEDIWDICEGTNYPKLSWQEPGVGDFVCPDGVDLADFAVLAGTWGLSSGQVGYNDLCDLMYDDVIDLADLAVFAENWMEGK
ncbi:MAG: hypothetical protein KAJ52_01980 [Sedimentisphaerales bacterium]|nr:hypothetical protein [Sedimentisphaerales bacterium]